MEDHNVDKLRILLVEDHEWARIGLSLSIQGKSTYEIIAQAENGLQAVELAKELKPDIILMDIGLPVMDGIEATRIIKQCLPSVKVVMLTSHREESEVAASLGVGANAYCLKDIKIERLIQVLDMVSEGATWFDPGVNNALMNLVLGKREETKPATSLDPHAPKAPCGLTDRETEVLTLIVKGCSNKEIAQELNITIHTVKIHVGNLIQKLGVDDRTQAAVKALHEGLVVL